MKVEIRTDEGFALEVDAEDASYHYVSIDGEEEIVLKFALTEYRELPLGCYVRWGQGRYDRAGAFKLVMYSPAEVTKNGERSYAYTATFSGMAKMLERLVAISPGKGKSFVATGAMEGMCAVVRECLAFKGEGIGEWEVEICDNWWKAKNENEIKEEKVIDIDGETMAELCSKIAEEYECRWWVETREGTHHLLFGERGDIGEERATERMRYGKGNGLLPGLRKRGEDGTGVVTRVYANGSDRNIYRERYEKGGVPMEKLCLPDSWPSERAAPDLWAYREKYEIEGRGISLKRKSGRDAASPGGAASCRNEILEKVLEEEEIYPVFETTVQTIVRRNVNAGETEDTDKWFYDFICAPNLKTLTNNKSMTAAENIIGDETVTCVFQSGNLVGREFDVHLHGSLGRLQNGETVTRDEFVYEVWEEGRRWARKSYDELVRIGRNSQMQYIQLVQDEEGGYAMPGRPGSAYGVNEGDRVRFFNCNADAFYERTREDSAIYKAEVELLRKAVRYMEENGKEEYELTASTSSVWTHANESDLPSLGDYIAVRDFVERQDAASPGGGGIPAASAREPLKLRVSGIKTIINNPYEKQIDFSGGGRQETFAARVEKGIEEAKKEAVASKGTAVRKAKRSLRQSEQTIEALGEMQKTNGALMTRFTEGISPVAVHTMTALVGDEGLQYILYDEADAPMKAREEMLNIKTADGMVEFLREVVRLRHTTFKNRTLTMGAREAMPCWRVQGYDADISREEWKEKALYVYFKCERYEGGDVAKPWYDEGKDEGERWRNVGGTMGDAYIEVYDHPMAIEPEDGDANYTDEEKKYYYFLFAILNAVDEDGERGASLMCGFTEISPGRVTTERIVSADGESYWDMANNAFRLGNKIEYNTEGDGKLLLRGVLVQSLGGKIERLGSNPMLYMKGVNVERGDVMYVFKQIDGKWTQVNYESAYSAKTGENNLLLSPLVNRDGWRELSATYTVTNFVVPRICFSRPCFHIIRSKGQSFSGTNIIRDGNGFVTHRRRLSNDEQMAEVCVLFDGRKYYPSEITVEEKTYIYTNEKGIHNNGKSSYIKKGDLFDWGNGANGKPAWIKLLNWDSGKERGLYAEEGENTYIKVRCRIDVVDMEIEGMLPIYVEEREPRREHETRYYRFTYSGTNKVVDSNNPIVKYSGNVVVQNPSVVEAKSEAEWRGGGVAKERGVSGKAVVVYKKRDYGASVCELNQSIGSVIINKVKHNGPFEMWKYEFHEVQNTTSERTAAFGSDASDVMVYIGSANDNPVRQMTFMISRPMRLNYRESDYEETVFYKFTAEPEYAPVINASSPVTREAGWLHVGMDERLIGDMKSACSDRRFLWSVSGLCKQVGGEWVLADGAEWSEVKREVQTAAYKVKPVYMGEWNEVTVYSGDDFLYDFGFAPTADYIEQWKNDAYVQIVRKGERWYVTRADFNGRREDYDRVCHTDPETDTEHRCWIPFGGSLDSVATSLLLAENAEVAGWRFRSGRLESAARGDWEPMSFLNGETGEAKFGNMRVREDGSITIKNLWATNGTFSGDISARSLRLDINPFTVTTRVNKDINWRDKAPGIFLVKENLLGYLGSNGGWSPRGMEDNIFLPNPASWPGNILIVINESGRRLKTDDTVMDGGDIDAGYTNIYASVYLWEKVNGRERWLWYLVSEFRSY